MSFGFLPDTGSTVGVQTMMAGSTTMAGYADGVGTVARFNDVYGMALSEAENLLYITDYINHRIRTCSTSGK